MGSRLGRTGLLASAGRFLGDLAKEQRGQVVLANLAAALSGQYVPRADCRTFLEACAKMHGNLPDRDGRRAKEVFNQQLAQRYKELFFRRQITAGMSTAIALVVKYSFFFPQDHVTWQREGRLVFSRDYVESVKLMLGPLDQSARPEQAMEDIATGFRQHLDSAAQIGRNEFVVFITRADPDWLTLLGVCSQQTVADNVRDVLGLDYASGEFLVELRTDIALEELAKTGIKMGAPTALEAWRCDFFRQIPDTPDNTGWGRTVHLGRLRSGLAQTDGAPEAIIELLPLGRLRDHIQLQLVGIVKTGPPVRISDHLSRLLGPRTTEELIEEILRGW